MSKSLTQDVISFVSKRVHSELKASGWKRRAPHIFKPAGDVFHCLTFQSSRWGTLTEGQFTIDLVVTWPHVYRIWTSREFPRNPAAANFPIRERIGMLTPNHLDGWWHVNQHTDREDLSKKVTSTLVAHGLSFFEPFPNTAAILALLRSGKPLPGLNEHQLPLIHAIMAAAIGEIQEAKERLSFAFKQASPLFQETVSLIADRLKIEI